MYMTGQIKMSTRIIIGSHDLPCSLPLTFSFDDLMPYWVTENLTFSDDLFGCLNDLPPVYFSWF